MKLRFVTGRSDGKAPKLEKESLEVHVPAGTPHSNLHEAIEDYVRRGRVTYLWLLCEIGPGAFYVKARLTHTHDKNLSEIKVTHGSVPL